MKVKCTSVKYGKGSTYTNLWFGEIYDVLKNDSWSSQYLIRDTSGRKEWYDKKLFKEVEAKTKCTKKSPSDTLDLTDLEKKIKASQDELKRLQRLQKKAKEKKSDPFAMKNRKGVTREGIQIRNCGVYKGKSFFLLDIYDWTLVKDDEDQWCLIPLKKGMTLKNA